MTLYGSCSNINRLILCEFNEERKLELGVRPNMLRLSVGIEDIEDLEDELEKGLRAL